MTQIYDPVQKKIVDAPDGSWSPVDSSGKPVSSNPSTDSGAAPGSTTADPYQDPTNQNKLRELLMGAAAKKGQFGTAATILNTISKERTPEQKAQDQKTADVLNNQLDSVTSKWEDPSFFQSNPFFRVIGNVQDRPMSPAYESSRKAYDYLIQQMQADKRLPNTASEAQSYNDLFPDQWDNKSTVQKKVDIIKSLITTHLNLDPPAIATDPSTGASLSIQDDLNSYINSQITQ